MNKSLTCAEQLPAELLKTAKWVYMACNEGPAEHISQLLTMARARIHQLEEGNRNLYRALLEKKKKRQPVIWEREREKLH